MIYQVGLTGGIASGKSTVAQLFVERGATLVDADLIAHQVVAAGTPGLRAVVKAFGETMLTETGELNRPAMRERVFSDPSARRRLEAIVHPLVRAEMARQITDADGPYCVVDVPLLTESAQHYHFDRVLVVDVSVQTQIDRLKARDGLSDSQIAGILDAQASRDQRLALADDTIDNNGALEALPAQVELLHQRYLAEAKEKGNPV
ncbi:MAG: dephospho-CoA kinase [Pseudomonadota bacterium]